MYKKLYIIIILFTYKLGIDLYKSDGNSAAQTCNFQSVCLDPIQMGPTSVVRDTSQSQPIHQFSSSSKFLSSTAGGSGSLSGCHLLSPSPSCSPADVALFPKRGETSILKSLSLKLKSLFSLISGLPAASLYCGCFREFPAAPCHRNVR